MRITYFEVTRGKGLLPDLTIKLEPDTPDVVARKDRYHLIMGYVAYLAAIVMGVAYIVDEPRGLESSSDLPDEVYTTSDGSFR